MLGSVRRHPDGCYHAAVLLERHHRLASAASKPLLALLFVLGLEACGGRPCPTQPHTNPFRALEQHRSQRQPVMAISGEARVDQRGAEGRIRGTVFMLVQRPDHVRFDAMTQLGPAAVLTSDGTQFQLLDLRDDRFLQGPACPSNIARLVGIPLSGEQLTQFLLGDSPRIDAKSHSIACVAGGNYMVTLLDAEGWRQEIELAVRDADRELPPAEQHTRLVRSELFTPDGSSEWRATFDDFRFVADPSSHEEPRRGVVLPHRVHFVGRGADTLVKFITIELNAEIPEGAFTQQPPAALVPQTVSCQ